MIKPSWEVEITEEFGAWFSSLREADQDAVADKVPLLVSSADTWEDSAMTEPHRSEKIPRARRKATWQDLLDRTMSPKRQAASRERARRLVAALPLAELRKARELTQQALAETLERDQAAVSTLERRTDAYVSTLRRYIEAMGGELEIVARFPDGDVRITQFSGD